MSDISVPVRVFVGTDRSQLLAVKVPGIFDPAT
jgi:hypothetical protein